MIRAHSRSSRLLAGVLLSCAVAFAISPAAWHFRKSIPAASKEGLAVVRLDRDVYFGARSDLADLRVLRNGEEMPFVLETLNASAQRRRRPAAIVDQSVVPGAGLQFALHLDGVFPHNRIHLETSERDFRQAVRIETSENGKSWATVRDDGAIFDFSQGDRHMSALDVGYPVSTRRYLRVTVRGWSKVGALTGATVDFEDDRPASRETLATLIPSVTEDPATQSTLATVDAGAEGLPVDHIRVATPSPAFHRAVDIETSTNGKDWLHVVQRTIARYPGEPAAEDLSVAIPETHHRYFRLRVYNRDDKPIQIESVQLEGLIRRVKFLADATGGYWLYYGNPDAAAASYDLPALLERREHLDPTLASDSSAEEAGPQQVNPGYRPSAHPQPWSERHPAILYTVLGGAVLGLGAATLRFALRLRQPPPAP